MPKAQPRGPARVAIGFGRGRIDIFEFEPQSFGLIRQNGHAAGDMPSFLAFEDSQHLHWVNEESGHLRSGRLTPQMDIEVLTQTPCPGGPAYLSLSTQNTDTAQGKGLAFAADYGDGTLRVFERSAGQGIGKELQALDIGVYPHSAVLDPTGRYLYVPSKGSDYLAQFAIHRETQRLEPLSPARAATREGAGPRHLVFHPEHPVAYTSNELDSTIDLWSHDRATGQLSLLGHLSSLPEGLEVPGNTGSDIHLHPGGRYLYASNRGHDSIAVFSVAAEGRELSLLETVPTGGQVPRNFCLDPEGEVLLVANQEGRNLTAFAIDASTGRLSARAHLTFDDRPFWVGFWP